MESPYTIQLTKNLESYAQNGFSLFSNFCPSQQPATIKKHTKKGRVVIIKNVPSTNEHLLLEKCEEYGTIQAIFYNPEEPYMFVKYKEFSHSNNCIEMLNGQIIEVKKIAVERAKVSIIDENNKSTISNKKLSASFPKQYQFTIIKSTIMKSKFGSRIRDVVNSAGGSVILHLKKFSDILYMLEKLNGACIDNLGEIKVDKVKQYRSNVVI